MSLHDDVIRRWLDQAANDASPRLERVSEDRAVDGDELEEARVQMDRLRLVQGLLGTLDLRPALVELDALVQDAVSEALIPDLNGIEEVNFSELGLPTDLQFQDEDFCFEPHAAPEFLDRIVEQGITGSHEDPLGDGRITPARSGAWTASRRVMAGAALALVLLLAPYILGDRGFFDADYQGADNSLRLVNYNSLEGLQNAFPVQTQAARGMGIMGAFSASSSDAEGGR